MQNPLKATNVAQTKYKISIEQRTIYMHMLHKSAALAQQKNVPILPPATGTLTPLTSNKPGI